MPLRWVLRLGVPAVLAAVMLLATFLVFGLGGATQTSPAGAATGCQLGVDVDNLPAGLPKGKWDSKQVAMAVVIIQAGQAKKAPARAQVVALITALVESNLRNLANPNVPESMHYPHDGLGTDHASVNAFQQQAGMGWGAVPDLMNPSYAAGTFYRRLLALPGWATMDMGAAAQAVQRSAFPDRYAQRVGDATLLVHVLGGVDDIAKVSGCQPPQDRDVDGDRATIVNSALKWLGTPYVFDGGDQSGPTVRLYGGCDPVAPCSTKGFDCSGLSLYAWAQVGIVLDHYAPTQYRQGRQVPVKDAQPGDLLFWATNPADEASIHHVAIYLGDKTMIEAPQSGEVVMKSPVRYDGELMPMAVQPLKK